MLKTINLEFSTTHEGETTALLQDISLNLPRGSFTAIVGPSGCGKTTLLNTIAGLNPLTDGEIHWQGRDLDTEGDFEPSEIGYVPQFSVAYDALTVRESIENALLLRVGANTRDEVDDRVDELLWETGMSELDDRPIRVLSGGQKRRLGLAMELVSNPALLLCDEVTSGLDPHSEKEIVELLHSLPRQGDRTILSVTHSLAHLELYDSIIVLHKGRLVYHGPPQTMAHYFSVDSVEDIYPRIQDQDAEKLALSWKKHDQHYEKQLHAGKDADEGNYPEPLRTPGAGAQFVTLFNRRMTLLFRDRGQLILQAAILLGFPCLVAFFSYLANTPLLQYPDVQDPDLTQQTVQNLQNIGANRAKVGGAVSGLIMFQVVLLALMGCNNSGREIAAERAIMEKEKFGGVRPSAYLLSKLVYLTFLVVVQSVWMAWFVDRFWSFPAPAGGFLSHLFFLILINGAITSICLGISAFMATSEQASLLSIYLVGFQLPLSGAVLALPEMLGQVTRPLISAYWAWSGSISSLDYRYQSAIKDITETPLNFPSSTCVLVLGTQIGLGILAAYLGIRREQWRS